MCATLARRPRSPSSTRVRPLLYLSERHARTVVESYDLDTKLADRITAERAAAAQVAVPDAPQAPRQGSTPAERSYVRGTIFSNREPERPPSPSTALNALRVDLSATQKARGVLQNEVSTLTASLATSQKALERNAAKNASLLRQKADLERKLRDRDEELRGKARLVENAQDEMVSLSLQVNMAEQRSDRLEKENRELIARWMKRMGEEAEKVNEGSGWQ